MYIYNEQFWLYFILNLLVTIIVFVVPIVIYRYWIRKAPLSPSMAKIVAIVDAATILILFYVLRSVIYSDAIASGSYSNSFGVGAALLWGMVNYHTLISGKDERESNKPANTVVVDEKIEEKVVEKEAIDPIPVPDNITDKTTMVENIEASKSKATARFCKICGGVIDTETKICSNCGKRYFKGIPAKVVYIIGLVIIVFSLAANIYQYNQNHIQFEKISELNADIMEKTIKISSLSDEAEFMDYAVVIVPDNGTKLYHKYGCANLSLNKGFWVYNSEAAEDYGYKPCPVCNGN